jgi:hypothetical protein
LRDARGSGKVTAARNMENLLQQIRLVVTGIVVVVGSLVLGYWVANGAWFNLALIVILSSIAAAMVAPGYSALLALGILAPFSLPIPGFNMLPFMGFALALLLVKYVLRRALRGRDEARLTFYLPWGITVFFGIVLASYLVDPVLPGSLSGTRTDVTGFRPYALYGLSVLSAVSVAWFIRSPGEMRRLLRWLVGFSTVFCLFLIPLSLTRSPGVAETLRVFGLFVTAFDTGWLRFVVLGNFGLILITGAMLPQLLRMRPTYRLLMFCLGVAAVILSGSRAFVLMATVAVIVVAVLRRQKFMLHGAIWGCVLFIVGSWYAGEHLRFSSGVGLYRIVSLVSSRAAELSDAEQTVAWRKVRWEAALRDIQEKPWVGHGYRGLANAFIYANRRQFEMAQVDIDVANGTVHNGYLAGMRALGIPAALLVTLALLLQAHRQWQTARAFHPIQEPEAFGIHAFLAPLIIVLFAWIYTGADFNQPWIWFLVGTGLAARRLTSSAGREADVPAPLPVPVRRPRLAPAAP